MTISKWFNEKKNSKLREQRKIMRKNEVNGRLSVTYNQKKSESSNLTVQDLRHAHRHTHHK